MPDSPPEEEEQQQVQANTEFVLDAAFRQTIQEITANLTRVTDEKLGPLSQIEERTAEAENRIAAAVHTSETVKTRVSELKKQIQSMAEHIDDLENRSRRKNVWIIGLPEDQVFRELDTRPARDGDESWPCQN